MREQLPIRPGIQDLHIPSVIRLDRRTGSRHPRHRPASTAIRCVLTSSTSARLPPSSEYLYYEHHLRLALPYFHPSPWNFQPQAMATKLKLALLLCDTPMPSVLAEHGDYTSIFTNLFRNSLPKDAGIDFQLDPYDVRGKLEYPEDSQFEGEDAYKAVILTGSGVHFLHLLSLYNVW